MRVAWATGRMVRPMRFLAYVVVGIALEGCASRPVAVAAPVAPASSTPEPPQPTAQAAPAACSSWTVHVTRREQQQAEAVCQVAPIDVSSDLTAEVRRLAPGHVSVHVLEDHETATNVVVPRDLTGASFVVPQAGVTVNPRVESLAATVLDWPQPDPASMPAALKAVVGMHLRGTAARDVSVTVHPTASTTFALVLDASESDAGMCHAWNTVAHLDGRLTLDVAEGMPTELALKGPTWTTEALCAAAGPLAGPPKTCTKGDIAIAMDVSCAAAP